VLLTPSSCSAFAGTSADLATVTKLPRTAFSVPWSDGRSKLRDKAFETFHSNRPLSIDSTDPTLCFGTRVAVVCQRMHYDLIFVIAFLVLLLVGGILLIVDAAFRLFRMR